jgi:subtilisin family serine protease
MNNQLIMSDHSFAGFESDTMWAGGKIFKTREDMETHLQNTIFKPLLEDSFKNGIVVVCAAGNDGQRNVDVSTLAPAALARNGENFFPQLIVVGSVGATGELSTFTSKDSNGIITVYTNGEGYIAASYQDNNGWSVAQGTSEATAMASGLVAYFLGKPGVGDQLRTGETGEIATRVKEYLKSKAYQYTSGGPLILNNGEMEFAKNAACSLPSTPKRELPNAGLVKRDGFSLTTTAFTNDLVSFSGIQMLDEC